MIAIDFDGVIINRTGIPRNSKWFHSEPTEGAVDALMWLMWMDIDFYIFTARPKRDWEKMKEWLEKYDLHGIKITNQKMNSTMYIDDRAYRFTNWKDICKLLG